MAGAFLLGTFTLAINDHVLKGSPLAPGWLTGKLSDFFGLIVAPLTLIGLFGARSARARLVCCAAPALVFAAINLSTPCSDLFIEFLAMTGVSWRLWPDASDLVALSVLPLSYVLGGWLVAERPAPSASVSWIQRWAIVLGALSCAASGIDPRHSSRAYVVNRTGDAIEVELSELKGSVNCQAHPRFDDELLRHGDFAQGTLYRIEANGVLPLGEDCAPVRVRVGDRTFGVVWDEDTVERRLPNEVERSDLDRLDQLVLVGQSGEFPDLRFGPKVRELALLLDADPIPPSACQQASIPRIEWSISPGPFRAMTLTRRDALGGTCSHLTLEAPDSTEVSPGVPLIAPIDLYLCLPESEFPFAVGDVVSGDIGENTWQMRLDADPTRALELYRGQRQRFLVELAALELTPSSCYFRDACGAVWETLDASFGETPLAAGVPTALSTPVAGAERGTLIRAMRPIVLRRDCDPASESFWEWIELVTRSGDGP